jgi:transposase
MAKALNADKRITAAHFDEIFGKGQRPKRCTLVLRDEHGRIFVVKQVEERTEETVCAFLEEVKSWGLDLKSFYVDGCEAYRAAIMKVFPGAVIQYDYFHVIQNVWRKLWKAVVARRKELKVQGESDKTSASSERLLSLAKRIWEKRHMFFKHDEKLTDEEQQVLQELQEQEPLLARVRGFVKGVWHIFQDSKTEEDALANLAELKARPEVEPGSPFAKAIAFLHGRFSDMVAYLRHPTFMQRNSLAETGIRCLRRLEQGHDGFRGPDGMDRYVRLYQAIKYCGWTVHRFTSEFGLPPTEGPALEPSNPPMLLESG